MVRSTPRSRMIEAVMSVLGLKAKICGLGLNVMTLALVLMVLALLASLD